MSTDNKLFWNSNIRLSVLIISLLSLFFNTCQENPNDFTLGEEYVESQTDLNLIDTFSVSLSTVILDTVITSGTGRLLIGNYRDDIFGKVTSSSYFQIGMPDNADLIDNDDVYDSLRLVIRYNNYFYGDTTKSQKILVHQLTENIKLDENDVITSNTEFNYNPELVGSIIYSPRPNNSIDTLTIKISDGIGLDLFTKLKDGSEILTDDESFINYFHGLVLKADDSYEGSIIGFSVDDAKLILYTSRNGGSDEELNYEFLLEDSTRQFNNVKHDFTSTRLNSLTEQRSGISNTKTDGLSFLQGGIGLEIRVDFPSLQEILLRDRGKIVKAQLSIAPSNGSYNVFDLPSDLVVYDTDKQNRITASQFSFASTLNVDKLYNEQTAYLFDITEYLSYELSDSYVDPEKGFLILLQDSGLQETFERLIIDAKNRNTKLKIYYLSY